MRPLIYVASLAVLLNVANTATMEEPVAQSPLPSQSHPSLQIVVKIRNGKTGLPVWLATPYVVVGKADLQKVIESHRRTKLWGDAHIDVNGAIPQEVKVWVDFIHRDCRYTAVDWNNRTDIAGNTARSNHAYDIGTILTEGIVAPNLCSTMTQRPQPGVLTIYVLPATMKELWNY